MTEEQAIKGLKENLCSLCAYGSQNMDSCDISECDNRDYIKALEHQPSEHITCKCCKYWIEEKHRKDDLGVCVCFSKAHVTCHLPKDFYCKFAERKKRGEND